MHLQRGFGFQGVFRDVTIMAQAAMFQTAAMEDSSYGSIRCTRSQEDGPWYEGAMVTQLAELQN
jgi:hypothetical protein